MNKSSRISEGTKQVENLHRQQSVRPSMIAHVRRIAMFACVAVLALSLAACVAPWQKAPSNVYKSNHFASSQLGISFDFNPSLNGDGVTAKQVGSTVYVYDTLHPYTDGQFVQVIAKDPHDSLQMAISKLILNGYNPSLCLIGPARGGSSYYPANYMTASITYVTTPDPVSGWPTADPANCPTKYVAAPDGGEAYFLMDTHHPSKLLFISIGLSGIGSSADPASHRLWQDTISIQ